MVHALACDYDIHYVCIVGNSPLCLLPGSFGEELLLNVDGQDAEREKWKGFAKTYIRWTERLAAQVRGHADRGLRRSSWSATAGSSGAETVFVPYGANPHPRAEAARAGVLERFGLEPNGYVLFVSRLTPENGAHVLIEAFKKSGTALKLAIVGDAPTRTRTRRSCSGAFSIPAW